MPFPSIVWKKENQNELTSFNSTFTNEFLLPYYIIWNLSNIVDNTEKGTTIR